MPRGADIIAARLKAQGCEIAFGMPGGEVLALLDGLRVAGIRFQLVKHENAGGFMAEAYWHRQVLRAPEAPMAPGILVTTIGPGAANAVNVAANALQERVPLIILTGRVDPAEAESYTHQVIDHQAMFRPVVKASLAASAGAVARMIDRAVAIALDGQPGPVHVDVPISVAEGEEREVEFSRPASAPPAADSASLEAARRAFARAERVLIIAGVDALNAHTGAGLKAAMERFNAPLITTYKAKGIVPEDYPLALGGAGLSPKADAILLPLLRDADCILLAGYDPIEMRINWRDPFPPGVPVIELAATLPTHQMHRADHLLIGDVAANLAALTAGGAGKLGIAPQKIVDAKAALASAFAPEAEWGPGVVFDTIRRLAPREAIATVDSGAHRILMSQMWRSYHPRGVLQSSAFCTMGGALPLAIGAQIAEPDATVIAFVGDAGLEMGIGELATARDLGLPIIVVVLQDERLALIDLKQRASNYAETGVAFGATDFAAIAKAFGGEGISVADKRSLESAFGAALAQRDRFTLIAARIPPDAYRGRL